MSDLLRYAAAVLAVLGSLFCFLAALGVVRLPDVYTRLHAASKAGVVGAGMILLAAAVSATDGAAGLRAILGIVFLLLVTPVSAHLLARAAYSVGVKPDASTNINEMPTVKED